MSEIIEVSKNVFNGLERNQISRKLKRKLSNLLDDADDIVQDEFSARKDQNEEEEEDDDEKDEDGGEAEEEEESSDVMESENTSDKIVKRSSNVEKQK